jgi:glycosyltransferase involved in cell wall biosynthesis
VDIPNGVDTAVFQPREKNAELIERHGLSGKTVVLFVGNMQPFKGLQVLIDAMGLIPNDRIMLVIVGGGYAEKDYRKQVQARGLENRVIFAGPQKPAGLLPAYYNLCDLLVLPSTYSESFGLVVLEAMASGKPVIVSSLPGPASLVEPGKDGLVAAVGDAVDLKNRIEDLAGNPALREEMGTAARKKALEQYSWETIGKKLEGIFQEMLRK